MSKLLSVLGVILLAVGLVLGLLELMQPGRVQGLGISIGTAVDLIIGGVLALGLGGVISAVGDLGTKSVTRGITEDEFPVPGSIIGRSTVDVAPAPDAPVAEASASAEPAPSRMRFGFGKKLAANTAAVGAAVEAAPAAVEATPSPVQETLDALEQAKQDIKGALGDMDAVAAPAEEPRAVPEPEPEPEITAGEEELYVVEEKMIRGRPARILSDDTVEAETDEGWMRFENIEHLNEYLDAAAQ